MLKFGKICFEYHLKLEQKKLKFLPLKNRNRSRQSKCTEVKVVLFLVTALPMLPSLDTPVEQQWNTCVGRAELPTPWVHASSLR